MLLGHNLSIFKRDRDTVNFFIVNCSNHLLILTASNCHLSVKAGEKTSVTWNFSDIS